MSEFSQSRRDFLRMAVGVPVGLAFSMAMDPITYKVDQNVTAITNHPTGNAGRLQEVEAGCQPETSLDQCIQDYVENPEIRRELLIYSPVIEELGFRMLPSLILDHISGDQDPINTVWRGTDYIKPTRKEIIVGAISSIVFGLVHNLTETGVDTKTIPSSHMVGGFGLWALQRRFGTLSNITAHAAFNYRMLNKT